MSGEDGLEARVSRRVHPSLTIDVSLSLGPECGVVFGPSGAGKTSLLRLIAGLDRPASGVVRVGGDVLFDADRRVNVPLRRRRIGMIFQDDLLFPHLRVRDNIRFGLKGRPASEADARLAEVAALCGVEALLDRKPDTLSGGERQRVGLARALAPRPRLLLCDEPVSAIDLDGRTALVERLRAVQRAEGLPLLYVTHSPTEAIALGSRLFLLADGRIVDEGLPLDVLTSSRRRSPLRLDDLRNLFSATITSHAPDGGETHLRLDGGPTLIVPFLGRPLSTPLTVGIRADDILLALGPIDGLSARNRLPGVVDRIASHGAEAEVVVATGSLSWIVSVVASAISSLALSPGSAVTLIIKARSCHVLDERR